MNVQAQNAMLKTIEEPPAYAVILLLTTNLDKLLETVKSRCLKLQTKPIRERDVLAYLTNIMGLTKEKAYFCLDFAQGNLGKAIKLAVCGDRGFGCWRAGAYRRDGCGDAWKSGQGYRAV